MSSTNAVSNRKFSKVSPEKMAKKIARTHELPILNNVATQLNTLLQDTDVPAQQLADFMEKDQAIVPKILKLVNSSFFGFNSKIISIRHAIMLLGYNTVRNAVLSISVIDSMKLSHKFKGFDIATFWNHAISVATITRYLDEQTGNRFNEYSFTAGLIHDTGKLFLANQFPEEFAQVLIHSETEKLPFYAAEKELFPVQHDYMGAELAKLWNFPDLLTETIRYHHIPARKAETNELVLLVNVADILSRSYLEKDTASKKMALGRVVRDKYRNHIHNFKEQLPNIKKDISEALTLLLGGGNHA